MNPELLHMLPLPLAVEWYDAQMWTIASLVSLLTLTLLEVILGIDNIVFIAILSGKLPEHQRARARTLGLAGAMITRILFLCAIAWILSLERYTLFTIPDFGLAEVIEDLDDEEGEHGVQTATDPAGSVPTRGETATGDAAAPGASAPPGAHGAEGHVRKPLEINAKELILLLGGLFLLAKATYEIHDKLEGTPHERHGAGKMAASFGGVIAQIMILDVVFSIDSVITAVGIADYVAIMIVAVMVSVGVMLAFAGPISRFVEKHPTIKMLALSFLILIGLLLVVETFEVHVPKGYVYFAMAFSLGVELMNIRLRKVSTPVTLRQSYVESQSPDAYGDLAGMPPLTPPR